MKAAAMNNSFSQSSRIEKRLHLFPKEQCPFVEGLGLTYKAQPGDTFTVSYPRSGRNWTRCIIWSLNHNGAALPKDRKLYLEYPALEREGRDAVENAPKPRVICSHLPMDLVPYSPEAKYIVIVRNPKDVVVSYHYLYAMFGMIDENDLHKHVENFLKGEVFCGSYFDHLCSYMPYMANGNCLLLFYENLIAEPMENVKKLANFLGKTHISQEVLEKVVENTEIAEMRKDQSRWHGAQDHVVMEEIFIRKGKVGGWRNYLTKDQSDAIDKKFQELMGGTVAENWWQDVMRWEQ